jgi:hypothetical protein
MPMKKQTTIYFKNPEGELDSAELTTEWMSSKRGALFVYIIGTTQGKGPETETLTIPIAIVELIPQKELKDFIKFLEKIKEKYHAGKDSQMKFAINSVPVKDIRKIAVSILDKIDTYLPVKAVNY